MTTQPSRQQRLERHRRAPYSNVGSSPSGDAGNAVVESAILAPLFILFLAGLLIAMRIQHGSGVVSQAAADAARHASIARTATQAQADANSSAMTTLRDKGLHCRPHVRLTLSGFHREVGKSASVSAEVTCVIRLADLALPGMPGTRTVTRSHRSPIDPYRGKSLGSMNSERAWALNRSIGDRDGPS